MLTLILVLIIIIAALAYIFYVGLIKKKNQAIEALAGIDVQLRKRHNIIPNVLKLAKKFMQHEKSLLTEITELRTSVLNPITGQEGSSELAKRFAKENQLDAKMKQLLIAVENYPQLKSDSTIAQAQHTYNEVEEHIAAARRFYNSAVTILNNAVEIFPGNLVAGMLNIKKMAPFKASPEDAKAIDVETIL